MDDELNLDYEPPKNLLTMGDVAIRLNVSIQYVQHLAQEGKLPVVNLGHKTKRIDPASVDELIRSNTLAQLPVRKRVPAAHLRAGRNVMRGKRPPRQGTVEKITSLDEAEQALVSSEPRDELEL